MPSMLDAAMGYYAEGLCCIPIAPRDKRPAQLPEWKDEFTWERYHTERPQSQDVARWWRNGHNYNIGIVHGPVSGNYITIDLDHDQGLFEALQHKFPYLFVGRIEQSGSGEGYHIPLFLKTLPDLGQDHRRKRPKGNKTWKTKLGDANIRVRWCQTVVPPSIHPSGNVYRFVQPGHIAQLEDLNDVIAWLDAMTPSSIKTVDPNAYNRPIQPSPHTNLLDAVKAAWPSVLDVFRQFGVVGRLEQETNGELRVLGNGGLLIAEDGVTWYSFSAEEGGGVVEAWSWLRFGSVEAKRKHYRQILIEMAQAAGLDVAQYYRSGDERHQGRVLQRNNHWTQKYPAWGEMRTT